jgi:hypothetical protein
MVISLWIPAVGVAALVALGGCATTSSVQPGGGGTTFVVRDKSYDEVWKAAVATTSRSLTIVESSKDTGTLRAEKGVGLSTWGEVVGVFVRPAAAGAASYTVEVQSLKRNRLQLTGQDWTATIVSGMKAELGQ